MQKVKFNRTVSFNGKMYLRGSEAVLTDDELEQLVSYYEPVKIKGQPQRVDIIPRNTAMTSPEARITKTMIDKLSWAELRELAKNKGIPANQKREDLEAQLLTQDDKS